MKRTDFSVCEELNSRGGLTRHVTKKTSQKKKGLYPKAGTSIGPGGTLRGHFARRAERALVE